MGNGKRGRPRTVQFRYSVEEGVSYDPNEQPVEYWLSTCKNKHTRYMYQVRFENFENFTGKSGKEMLQERISDVASGDLIRAEKYNKLAVDFYEKMNEKYSSHTAWSNLTAVRSFFGTFGKHLELVVDQYLGRAGKKKPQAEKKKHKFTLDEVKALYEVGDWYEKSILILGVQCGLARNEVVSLRVEDLKPWLNLEPPVGPIELVREKTDEKIKMILGRDAVETLRTFIGDREEGWLFESSQNHGTHITPAEPDRVVKRLWKRLPRAYKPRGKVIYHGLRDFFSNAMQNGGMPFLHVELLMGHVLPQNGAYTIPTDEVLREEYKKAEPNISVRRTYSTNTRLENLEEITNLAAKALAELLKPILEKLWLQQQLDLETVGETIGLLRKPDFENMSEKEIIKEYLRLTKGERA